MSKHQLGNIVFGFFTLIYVYGYLNLGWSLSYFIWGFIAWFLLILSGSFFIQANYHLKALTKVKTVKKVVAITFDDGPSSFTKEVLDILDKHNALATFFCVGKNVEKETALFKSIIEKGHSVGNHTYSHSKDIGFSKTKTVITEIEKTDEVIEKYSGSKPKYYRPPFGVTNPRIARALNKTQHEVIGWNIRSLDTFIHDETKIYNRIVRQIKPGSIILLHDTSERSVSVLERLLIHLDSINYRSVTVDELLKEKSR
jgi:peptidoglycan/xylan/chitin deacetylase (PgdA/CDA1 family)